MGKWSNKDERQYEHIKEGSMERGVKEDRAKEIAARTVNKTRREDRRTPKKTTEGTGNPNVPLSKRSKEELMNRARDLSIEGRSKMNKDELAKAVRDRSG